MLFANMPDVGPLQNLLKDLEIMKFFPEDPLAEGNDTEYFKFEMRRGNMTMKFGFGGFLLAFNFPTGKGANRFTVTIIDSLRDTILLNQHYYLDHRLTSRTLNAKIFEASLEYRKRSHNVLNHALEKPSQALVDYIESYHNRRETGDPLTFEQAAERMSQAKGYFYNMDTNVLP